jgi:hypothetical protein
VGAAFSLDEAAFEQELSELLQRGFELAHEHVPATTWSTSRADRRQARLSRSR